MMLLIGIAGSCSSDDNNNMDENVINVQELTSFSTSGTWRITSYVDDGETETHHFTNYTFTFKQDGTVTAVNGDTTITGTWAISDDDDDDDDSSSSNSDKDFVLNFNVDDDSEFEDLNDDWDIHSYSSNKISLGDVSGGDGSTDTLVFEKN